MGTETGGVRAADAFDRLLAGALRTGQDNLDLESDRRDRDAMRSRARRFVRAAEERERSLGLRDGARATATLDTPVELVIVEDHLALRRGLELLLRKEGHRVLGMAESVDQAFAMIRRRRPQVAVIDVKLGGGSGVELTKRLLAEDDRLGVLLYTGFADEATLRDALDCGARGFALKTGDPEQLYAAIRAVAAGGTFVDQALVPFLLSRSTTDRISVLTPREREMLDLLSQGLRGDQIAQRLFLSQETVRTHVRNAMNKLEASTRGHAIAIALRQGEID
jgi:DNA-binding NarL/FixJ family response regulator